MGLEQVVGQLGVGPVRPVQALFGRSIDDPPADLVGQARRDRARGPLGFAGPEPAEPAFQVGVEPALDSSAVDAQVGGDVLVSAAAMGQEDDWDGCDRAGAEDFGGNRTILGPRGPSVPMTTVRKA